jgi:hypothetical protein
MDTKRIFVLGNSHLRSLNNNNKITPIFLGPASKISLLNKGSINALYKKIEKFFRLNIVNERDDIYLFFGEGPIRYSLNDTYYPHKIGIHNYDKMYRNTYHIKINKIIEDTIHNYKQLYDYV